MIHIKKVLYWPIFGKESSQICFWLYYYIWNVAFVVLVCFGAVNIKINGVVSSVFYKKSVNAYGNQLKAFKVLFFYSFKYPIFKIKKAYGKKRVICSVVLRDDFLYRFFGFLVFLSKLNEEVFWALNEVFIFNVQFFQFVFREAGMFLDLGMFGLDFFNWFVPLVVNGKINLVADDNELLMDNDFLLKILSICKIYLVKRE